MNGNSSNSTTTSASTGRAFSACTLEQLRHAQREFAAARDWQQFQTPRNLLLALIGEVGELSEIFQWRGEVAPGLPGWTDHDRTHVGEELSDCLLYLVRFADECDIDLAACVQRKMVKNAAKYPIDKCRGSSAKYTAYEQATSSSSSSSSESSVASVHALEPSSREE